MLQDETFISHINLGWVYIFQIVSLFKISISLSNASRSKYSRAKPSLLRKAGVKMDHHTIVNYKPVVNTS